MPREVGGVHQPQVSCQVHQSLTSTGLPAGSIYYVWIYQCIIAVLLRYPLPGSKSHVKHHEKMDYIAQIKSFPNIAARMTTFSGLLSGIFGSCFSE